MQYVWLSCGICYEKRNCAWKSDRCRYNKRELWSTSFESADGFKTSTVDDKKGTANIAVTKISAGVSTGIGSHAKDIEDKGDDQFEISDGVR